MNEVEIRILSMEVSSRLTTDPGILLDTAKKIETFLNTGKIEG